MVPRQTLDTKREVELLVLLETVLLGVGEHAIREHLGLRRREHRIVERPQLAVDGQIMMVGTGLVRRSSGAWSGLPPIQPLPRREVGQ